jgi:hypothetical protein
MPQIKETDGNLVETLLCRLVPIQFTISFLIVFARPHRAINREGQSLDLHGGRKIGRRTHSGPKQCEFLEILKNSQKSRKESNLICLHILQKKFIC